MTTIDRTVGVGFARDMISQDEVAGTSQAPASARRLTRRQRPSRLYRRSTTGRPAARAFAS